MEISLCRGRKRRRAICPAVSRVPDRMGLPVLTMELAVGRASRKSAVLGYKALEKPGSKWHLHGWAAIFGCYMLMMYYTTVFRVDDNLFL